MSLCPSLPHASVRRSAGKGTLRYRSTQDVFPSGTGTHELSIWECVQATVWHINLEDLTFMNLD